MSRPPFRDRAGKLVRFILVGLATALIDIGGLQGLIMLGLDPLAARAVSLSTAMLAAFQLNRRFTFGRSGRSQVEELARYGLVNAVSAGTSYCVFAVLLYLAPDLWPVFAAASGLAVSMWVSFFGFQYFAFARRRDA